MQDRSAARRLRLQGHRCTGLRVWSIFNQCALMTCTNLIRWTFIYFASWVFIRVQKEEEDRILFPFTASHTDNILKAKMFQSGMADGRVPKFFGRLSQTGLASPGREQFAKRRQNLAGDQKNLLSVTIKANSLVIAILALSSQLDQCCWFTAGQTRRGTKATKHLCVHEWTCLFSARCFLFPFFGACSFPQTYIQ